MGVPVVSGKKQESDPTMTHHQSALTTLISEVLADPDLAHSDVFGSAEVLVESGVYAARSTALFIMVSNSMGVSLPSRRCLRLRW